MGAIKINGSTSGSTTITAPATGSDESIELSTALASKLDLAGGKILQIVRATTTTQRSTTSATFVDANISVTITPQKSDSAVILIWSYRADNNAANRNLLTRITDSSNNPISGAEGQAMFNAGARSIIAQVLLAYATPATTSATTYKGQFAADPSGSSVTIVNNLVTGQLYAIEVSA